MKTGYTAYTEAVYKEQPDGTCRWLGRVYNRVGPARVLETHDGIAPSREDALVQVRAWSEEVLEENYRVPEERELQVITADDVQVVSVAELLGSQE